MALAASVEEYGQTALRVRTLVHTDGVEGRKRSGEVMEQKLASDGQI